MKDKWLRHRDSLTHARTVRISLARCFVPKESSSRRHSPPSCRSRFRCFSSRIWMSYLFREKERLRPLTSTNIPTHPLISSFPPHGSRPQPFNSTQSSYWYFTVQARVLSGMRSDQPPCYTRVGIHRRSSFGRVGCGYKFSRTMGPGPSNFPQAPPPFSCKVL